MIEKLKEIEKLVDKAYSQIDSSLNKSSFEKIEYGVALGLDDLLEIKRLLKENFLNN